MPYTFGGGGGGGGVTLKAGTAVASHTLAAGSDVVFNSEGQLVKANDPAPYTIDKDVGHTATMSSTYYFNRNPEWGGSSYYITRRNTWISVYKGSTDWFNNGSFVIRLTGREQDGSLTPTLTGYNIAGGNPTYSNKMYDYPNFRGWDLGVHNNIEHIAFFLSGHYNSSPYMSNTMQGVIRLNATTGSFIGTTIINTSFIAGGKYDYTGGNGNAFICNGKLIFAYASAYTNETHGGYKILATDYDITASHAQYVSNPTTTSFTWGTTTSGTQFMQYDAGVIDDSAGTFAVTYTNGNSAQYVSKFTVANDRTITKNSDHTWGTSQQDRFSKTVFLDAGAFVAITATNQTQVIKRFDYNIGTNAWSQTYNTSITGLSHVDQSANDGGGGAIARNKAFRENNNSQRVVFATSYDNGTGYIAIFDTTAGSVKLVGKQQKIGKLTEELNASDTQYAGAIEQNRHTGTIGAAYRPNRLRLQVALYGSSFLADDGQRTIDVVGNTVADIEAGATGTVMLKPGLSSTTTLPSSHYVLKDDQYYGLNVSGNIQDPFVPPVIQKLTGDFYNNQAASNQNAFTSANCVWNSDGESRAQGWVTKTGVLTSNNVWYSLGKIEGYGHHHRSVIKPGGTSGYQTGSIRLYVDDVLIWEFGSRVMQFYHAYYINRSFYFKKSMEVQFNKTASSTNYHYWYSQTTFLGT